MSDWPVGLSTGCFYDRSIFDVLEPIYHGGFSMLEICSAEKHFDYHDRDALESLVRRLRDLDLEAYSFHAPYGRDIDITSLDDERRAYSREEILRSAEAAAQLNVRYFVIHPGPEMSEEPPAEERLHRLRNAASVLDVVSQRCAQLGIGFCLENMLPHLLFGNASDMLWILGDIRRVEVGVCLDTGHAHLARDITEIVRKFAGHLRMLHVHDNRGDYDDHLPPGEGEIDWLRLVGELRRIRFAGGLVLELSGDLDLEPDEMLARARHARWFLRDLSRRVALFGTTGQGPLQSMDIEEKA
ncbi:MAG TPA: sugar phosphate isomerase/epimerase family protein [Candidatus Krumholzibacteria bacterium]|nr:sugar phosphate isomerase/epimerase family protein [Candidatus Krumholzibacteria bacterium]